MTCSHCVNTGAEVNICHMLGKCEENSVSYLQVFLVSSNISFFLWVKMFAICLSIIVTLRRMDSTLGTVISGIVFRVGEVLVMIGQWYSRQPSTNHK